MKRFYEQVTIEEQDGAFTILLDGREVKTPEKRPALIPTKAMAQLVQAEWQAQVEKIDPFSMPLTKLLNTALDRVGPRRADLIDELVNYAGSDQLCYRAEFPDDLVALQEKIWSPLLNWLHETHDVTLHVTTGIMHKEQDENEIAKIRILVEKMEDFELTAFHTLTSLSGSVTIALNHVGGNITIEEAWQAGHLDENYQTQQWGEDEEAEDRRKALRTELDAAALFRTLCK